MAEQMLAEWLLNPAGTDNVEQRQHAVAELRSRLDLREDLFLVGDLVRRDVRPAALVAWGEPEPAVFAGLLRMLAPVLAAGTVLLLILDLTDLLPLWPFLAALLIELSVILALRKKVNQQAKSKSARSSRVVRGACSSASTPANTRSRSRGSSWATNCSQAAHRARCSIACGAGTTPARTPLSASNGWRVGSGWQLTGHPFPRATEPGPGTVGSSPCRAPPEPPALRGRPTCRRSGPPRQRSAGRWGAPQPLDGADRPRPSTRPPTRDRRWLLSLVHCPIPAHHAASLHQYVVSKNKKNNNNKNKTKTKTKTKKKKKNKIPYLFAHCVCNYGVWIGRSTAAASGSSTTRNCLP